MFSLLSRSIRPLLSASRCTAARFFSSKTKELPGMLTADQLVKSVRDDQIETVCVVFPDHIGRLMGKRYDANFFLETMKDGAHACTYLLTVDIDTNPRPGFAYANWERGYGDFHLVPDFATLRQAAWLNKTAIVICDVYDSKTHKLAHPAPRSILRKQIERANHMGFTPLAATELEYYMYRESYRDGAKKGFLNLEPQGWFLEDYNMLQSTRVDGFNGACRRYLSRSGVPVENSKGEWGLGQHELNLKYSDALTMADRHMIFKQCLKEVADAHGNSITFMAKVSHNDAGSSCHIHLSLADEAGEKNLFTGDKETAGGVKSSDYFRWFLGGWMKHMAEVMPFYAPTINSYKRFKAGSWAPTRIAWSIDNRTAGFRIVGSGRSLRIENRIPGADCNPYLGLAASLASGLDGIENKIEPPELFAGDVYAAQHLPQVPLTLKEANQAFAKSTFAKKAFGEDVVEHYAQHFKLEVDAYDSVVTDWERKRYFEQI